MPCKLKLKIEKYNDGMYVVEFFDDHKNSLKFHNYARSLKGILRHITNIIKSYFESEEFYGDINETYERAKQKGYITIESEAKK